MKTNKAIGYVALILFVLIPAIPLLIVFIAGIPVWFDGLSKPDVEVVTIRKTTMLDSLRAIDASCSLASKYYIEVSLSEKYRGDQFDLKLYCSAKLKNFSFPDDVNQWVDNIDIKEPLIFINGMKYSREVNNRYYYNAIFVMNEANEKIENIRDCLRCKIFYVSYFLPRSESVEFTIDRDSVMLLFNEDGARR